MGVYDHSHRRSDPDVRFSAKYVLDRDGCWVWIGAKYPNGYGAFAGRTGPRGTNRNVLAHRWAYERYVAPIRKGATVDHLCRNRACVNPEHLEVVSRGENSRRGGGVEAAAAKRRALTHCVHGHEFTPENTYVTPEGRRACKTCKSERSRRRQATPAGRQAAREASARWRARKRAEAVM